MLTQRWPQSQRRKADPYVLGTTEMGCSHLVPSPIPFSGLLHGADASCVLAVVRTTVVRSRSGHLVSLDRLRIEQVLVGTHVCSFRDNTSYKISYIICSCTELGDGEQDSSLAGKTPSFPTKIRFPSTANTISITQVITGLSASFRAVT